MIKRHFYKNNNSESDKIEFDVVKSITEDKEIPIEIDKDFKSKTVEAAKEVKPTPSPPPKKKKKK